MKTKGVKNVDTDRADRSPDLDMEKVADDFTSRVHLQGSRHQIKDGFRTSELLLLQRALGMYGIEYQKMKGAATTKHEKEESQAYIDAADRLSRRLRYELFRIDQEAK